MFVGHLALPLAARRYAPNVNLGWLVAGGIALDLIWPVLVLAGIEQVRIAPGATAFTPLVFEAYPWSHSLLMTIAWGVALAATAVSAGVPKSAGPLLAGLVVSHWVLDFITHAPDMPLWPAAGSPRFGLGLWNSIPATLAVEGLLWVAGITLYLRGSTLQGLGSKIAFWSLVVITTVMWAGGPWSPPPADSRALGWFALIGWIMIPWATLADRASTASRAT
jgi:hypothetical protein